MPLDDYTIKSYAEKFGSEICCSIVKNLTYLEHVHRSYEILYLLKGQIETEVQGHRFTLNKGDLYLLLMVLCTAMLRLSSRFHCWRLFLRRMPSNLLRYCSKVEGSFATYQRLR